MMQNPRARIFYSLSFATCFFPFSFSWQGLRIKVLTRHILGM